MLPPDDTLSCEILFWLPSIRRCRFFFFFSPFLRHATPRACFMILCRRSSKIALHGCRQLLAAEAVIADIVTPRRRQAVSRH